jgi:hypothetical protein
MQTAQILSGTEDFSVVLGGPLYQLRRRFHAAGPGLERPARRMIGISLIAWVPLLGVAEPEVRMAANDLHDVA